MKTFKQIFQLLIALLMLTIAVSSCKHSTSQNPFDNTEWKGMAKIPQESEVLLKFSSNQLDLLFQNRVIESMKYSIKGDHLILEKISGGSPCELGIKGEYQYEIIGDHFTISLLKDDCAARTASLKENVFTKTSASD